MPRQVNLLQAEHSPDMMLLAARALTFLADVMPASASSIVRHGAVQVRCAAEPNTRKETAKISCVHVCLLLQPPASYMLVFC